MSEKRRKIERGSKKVIKFDVESFKRSRRETLCCWQVSEHVWTQ